VKRDLTTLATHRFDLLVIGGGIYGACLAWEATRRGLSVALVEKADFASGTSANSLRIIHGGLRYLQQADFRRMRESIGERRRLMQLAPHLVHPLPVVIPTSGHGFRGREAMSLALAVNDLVSCDRNWQMDPQKRIPRGRTISKQECLERLPGLSPDPLTGGAIFYDAQVYNSERLVLAFLHSAAESGATLANYVEVTGFLQRGDRIVGACARDRLTDTGFEIQARTVINAAGPWINSLLGQLQPPPLKIPFAKAFNLVTRPLFRDYAVGISSPKVYQDADNWVNKGSRLFFIAPWRGYSLIGTAYEVCEQGPETFQVTEAEIQAFLADLNRAYPPAGLTRQDVRWLHQGLLPSSGASRSGDVQLTKHYQILDHRQHGYCGLFSVIGVKYTTARDVAEKAVNRIFPDRRCAGRSAPPLHGGEIDQFAVFLRQALQQRPQGLDSATMEGLVYNYGSAYPAVLRYLREPAATPFAVLRAQVRYGVQEEMAQTLGDILFRRTELGSAGLPEAEVLQICAETLGEELGWSPTRIDQELQSIGCRSLPAPL